MLPGNCVEKPCGSCGALAGGNLRAHAPGCSYVVMLGVQYPMVQDFLDGKGLNEGRRKPRKNLKHELPG